MSCITMHVCDVCGVTMHRGTRFVGLNLRTEKVDQGYWSSADQRVAELCYGCLGTTIDHLLARLYPTPVQGSEGTGTEETEKRG
jgi:hypothetical protein